VAAKHSEGTLHDEVAGKEHARHVREVIGAEQLKCDEHDRQANRSHAPFSYDSVDRPEQQGKVLRFQQVRPMEGQLSPGGEHVCEPRHICGGLAAGPPTDQEMHADAAEEEADDDRHVECEDGVAGQQPNGRERWEIAEQVLREGERVRGGIQDIPLKQRKRMREQGMHVP